MTDTLPATLDTQPAHRLEEVPHTAVLTPLDAGDRRYVDLSEGQQDMPILKELRIRLREVGDMPADRIQEKDYVKMIFSGHRGSGKTTELKLIERDLADQFYCIHLSLDDQNLIEGFDYTLFLLWLSEKIADSFRAEGMPLDETIVGDVGRWFVERTATEVDETALRASLEAEAKLSAGVGLLGYGLKLLGRVKTEARGSVTRREEIRSRLQSYATDLIAKVNLLLAEARDRLIREGRPAHLLIIQDNLDKLAGDVARRFFSDTGGLLRQVRAHTIFTAPVATTLAPFKIETVFSDSYMMPIIKPCTQEGKPFAPGIALLRRLVERRIDPGLFTDPALLDRLCFASGGNIRDLVRLAAQAARIARAFESPRIDERSVEEAVKRLRQEYERTLAPYARSYYPFLATIHRTKLYGDGQTDTVAILRVLLDNSAILEYVNGDMWFDVHPTIRESKAFQNALRDLPV